jgi:hypothetical protein
MLGSSVFLKAGLAAAGIVLGLALPAVAADVTLLDPTPVAEQRPAVDGLNFKAGVMSGVIGGSSTSMVIGSISTPIPYFSQFGAQLDFGAGTYRHDYTAVAAGLHLFWRDPSIGMLGIYGDYGYVNPEHAGRMGVEGALYNGPWSLDVFAGVQFGQHVLTEFVDEIDLSYYFTENLRGSVGHRLTSRGNVGNLAFEFMPQFAGATGWSVYGEAEAGEDDYSGAWLGLRYSFGTSSATSLMERDRYADPLIRIPRNLASVTRCGDSQDPSNYHKSWNGFETHYTRNICGSKEDLEQYDAIEGKL